VTVADRIVDARQEPGQSRALRAAGLFAGIGGIELGLGRARHTTEFFCEIDPYAQAVLRARFPGVNVTADIRDLTALPETVDLVTAGFPCQDLSQAGRTAGIGGRNSGLVGHVLDLLAHSDSVQWVVFENVPFMLHLDQGGAMAYLVDRLEALGFSWAYRVVDTRAFGLPQRRQRVVMIASRELDPRSVLLADDDVAVSEPTRGTANGFYWTEGLRGLGWAVDAVPTLKGGSTIGIPSPPAIWMRGGAIATPDIRDAERLQGFPVDWTLPAMAEVGSRRGTRWKLIGNAVTVPMAEWVGTRLSDPGTYDGSNDRLLPDRHRWPRAAWGRTGDAYMSTVSASCPYLVSSSTN
jgi:DNA (cytosine-5)-methyltransferase 1